ncbi:hypothetical protein [Nocardia sp. NBC_01327]|uniref:hypothetical protein n=1 Tax=Nocardia sp. NBC_01327 TaxID=2903593 RepID=UPI002E0DACF8|nr:hypothetical protein OG326_09195 [Nocardia sp. NBC_01327]
MELKRVAVLSTTVAAALVAGSGIAAAEADYAITPKEAMARAYIDALVSHNASAVKFTPDATRVEAGLQTGYSGPQLTEDLNHGVQYSVIQGIHDLRMSQDGDLVTTRYLLDSGLLGVRLATVDITETFVIPDDSIKTIVATIVPV